MFKRFLACPAIKAHSNHELVSTGIVGVLVPRQAAVDGLAQEIRQGELGVASGAGIGEVSFDQRTQPEALVQLAWQQQPGVEGPASFTSDFVRKRT